MEDPMDPRKKAQEKGRRNEEKFFEALRIRNEHTPAFFLKIDRGSLRADIDGFDCFAIIATVEKPEGMSIPVQIKSSRGGMMHYFEKRPRYKDMRVVVIIIRDGQSPEDIRQQTYKKLKPYVNYESDHFTAFLTRIFKRRVSKSGKLMKDKIARSREKK